jgi:hypothetical protein
MCRVFEGFCPIFSLGCNSSVNSDPSVLWSNNQNPAQVGHQARLPSMNEARADLASLEEEGIEDAESQTGRFRR